FLKAGAAGALGLTLAGPAFGRSTRIAGTTLNMLTWSDHYANDQLSAVNKATGNQGRPTLFADTAACQLEMQATGSQIDIVSGGPGTNPWLHSDQTSRTFFTLIMVCGCQGRNGGGWAHYVGQEKVRPLAGWQQVAFALDWQRPPRHMAGTSFFYLHTDQWRYEGFGASELASPLGRGLFTGRSPVDCLAQASRLGWTPSHPAFDRNPLDLADEAVRAGKPVADHVVDELRSGRLGFAAEDPDNPRNFPRVLTVWRANLLGSS